MTIGNAQGNFRSDGSGNWSNPGTWALTSGTDADGVPDADDNVLIIFSHSVVVDINSAANSVRLDNGTANISLLLQANLSVATYLTIQEPVADNITNTVQVGQYMLSAGSFDMGSGTANATRQRILSISTGTVSIAGNVIVQGVANTQIVFTGAGKMEIGGTFTRDAATVFTVFSGSTVAYTGAAQTVVSTIAYSNLTLSGSGAKTTTGVSVSGILSMEGTATASAAVTLGTAATLKYNTATSRTTGVEWPATFTSTGGIIIANTGTITLGAAKTINTGVTLTIENGAIFNPAALTLTVSGGATISNNGTIDFSNATAVIRSGTTGTSTLTMGATGVIKTIDPAGLGPVANASLQTQAGGAWTLTSLSTNGTIEYYRSADATGIITDMNYNNLTITNANAKTWTPAAARTINGTVTVNGVFTIAGAAQQISVRGDWNNSGGTFNPGNSTILFTNSGAGHQIGGTTATQTFNSLTVAIGSTNTLQFTGSTSTVVVNNTLTMTSGMIQTGTGVLALGVSAASTGTFTYTAGTIIGKFRRWVASGAAAVNVKFPVGTSTRVQTIDIDFSTTNRTAGGSLTTEFIASNPGALGLPQTVGGVSIYDPSPSGYWSVVNAGITGGSYTATVNATGFLFPNGVNTINDLSNTRLIKRSSIPGSSWESSASTGGTHNAPGNLNSVSASGLTTFSDFSVGVTCLSLPVPRLFGQSQCVGVTAVQFSVTPSNYSGTSFEWFSNTINSNSGGTSTGISTDVFTPPTTVAGTNYYYCVVTRGCDAKTTQAAEMIVLNPPITDAITDISVCNGETVNIPAFTGTGNIFDWSNNNAAIGLASSGSNNIAPFIANNSGVVPVTATIDVNAKYARAYIANRGSSIAVINTITNRMERLINTRGTPFGDGIEPIAVAINSTGTKAYYSNLTSNNVTVFNIQTEAVEAMMPTGGYGAHGIAISPDDSRVFVTNLSSNTVSVFSTATNTLIATINVQQYPIAVLVSQDGSKLFVTNQNSGTISVINAITLAPITTINIGGGVTGLAMHPDGTRLYASHIGSNSVLVINTVTYGIMANIVGFNYPLICVPNKDGSRLYVSNYNGSNVSVVNTASNSIISSISIASGGQASGLSFTPDFKYLFATGINGYVFKIDVATNTVVDSYSSPYVLAGPFSYGNFVSKVGSCSGTPETFTITVNPTPTAPNANAQTFCNQNDPRVADLQATGSNLKWYNVSSGGMPLNSVDPITSTTYYVSQTVNNCESARTSVTVTIENGLPVPPLAINGDAQTRSISSGSAIDIYSSAGCRIIGSVNSAGTSPVSGSIAAKTWIESSVPTYAGQPFVARHYEITPVTNPSTATGRITLYFTQQEFTDFNNHSSSILDLPTGPADLSGIANLRISKYAGTSSNGFGLPGTYAGTASVIDPADNDIVWNGTLSRWEVSFDVTGFSGFVIQTSSFTLPLTLLDFNGKLVNTDAVLTWTTENEINTGSFEIERSLDGRQYTKVGMVRAVNATGTHQYQFLDPAVLNTAQSFIFYRLKQIDTDGRFSYSRIVLLNTGKKYQVQVFPNPASDLVNLTIHAARTETVQVTVRDLAGRILISRQQVLRNGDNVLQLDISRISTGTYLVEVMGPEWQLVNRIVVQ